MAPPTNNPFDLPPLQAEEAAHSERLARHIRRELDEAGGRLGFERFMELALYTPGLGYYSGGRQKFGAQGDFITAPEISPLFSQCLANQCAQVLRQLDKASILEFGAGSGRMAADVLATLAQLDCLPEQYFIIELSSELQQRQRQTLKETVPELLTRVRWLSALPEKFTGIILANEVLDAMPVQRFRNTADGPRLLDVVCQDHDFAIAEGARLPPPLQQRLAALPPLTPGYESEFNSRAEAWVRSTAQCLDQGLMLLIDYGYPQTEYYHPDRQRGTLRCYFRHRAHDDPLHYLGMQDITAHVDFTAIAAAGLDSGLALCGFSSQGGFLIGAGLEKFAGPRYSDDAKQQAELAQQIRKLTLPGEMGEAFKVLALGRGVTEPLVGFEFNDQRWRLGL